jgi:hypothetical protein
VFFARNKRQESFWRLLTGFAGGDLYHATALWTLFHYMLMDRGALPWSAMRRARFVVGTALRRDYRSVPNGVLMLDEGPVNYLVNVGGYGPGWDGWETILMPDPREVEVRYVILHATAPETERRFVARARVRKFSVGPTGKAGIGPEQRMQGHRYWSGRLEAAGAQCLWLDTSGRTPEEVTEEVLRFLAAPRRADVPDAAPL